MSESSMLVEHPVLTVECAAIGDGVRRAALIGELDLATAEPVEDAVSELIVSDDVAEIVLDLEGLEFLSSAGIATLCRLRALAVDCGKRFRIDRLSSGTARLFAITGVDADFGLGGS